MVSFRIINHLLSLHVVILVIQIHHIRPQLKAIGHLKSVRIQPVQCQLCCDISCPLEFTDESDAQSGSEDEPDYLNDEVFKFASSVLSSPLEEISFQEEEAYFLLNIYIYDCPIFCL